ncbi:MFS transporter [Siccirubricoccus sp. KC 17139]|uniref:MFS transporter n=1 Tax=Siccirubricoccus soli TaxID=2899147 RepID=A0ABT1D6V3_9PROT|nr:MFS transporter [Siccirubricoccus soli]MCO6416924.1 MFS transporter [Siccirubricoccus soli]MCP2683059.1 MFS transporter [Siccirubricoccus soli]
MRDTPGTDTGERFQTDIPARLDRLPFSGFHWRVVIALGITWILDGLEVTLVGSLAGAIHQSPTLALSETQIGLSASAYLIGAVSGALFFGWLADRIGRRRLFFITLMLYMAASIATGFTWDFWSFALCRALTGAGIGGEYAAVNSAIQELIPARLRGTTDLAVNGTFWGGAAIGAVAALVVLDPALIDPEIGWRAAFVVGGALALIVLLLRRHLPESPRWLMLHGRAEEAETVVGQIEREVAARHGSLPPLTGGPTIFHRRGHAALADVWHAMFATHRDRAVLGLVLMSCQAFCYNAVFFTYALVLTKFYGIPAAEVGWFMLPFALGNLAGPLLLGRFFDTVGRKPMITATYALAGLLMAATGAAFAAGWLSAWEQTAAWTVIFFFASAAASAAYLTVGESFPLEMRAMAIALFYALGTAMGGVVGPALFGWLIEGGERFDILWGYLLAAALMLLAAATEWRLGFAAEGRSLEDVAPPLSRAR